MHFPEGLENTPFTLHIIQSKLLQIFHILQMLHIFLVNYFRYIP